MRNSLLVRTLALLAGTVLTAPFGPAASAANDALDQAACVAKSLGPANVSLSHSAGADRYDLGWMAEREHFGGPRAPYRVHLRDPESPRSLIAHDRLILPGTPGDWVAATRGADLVLCARRSPAVVVIARQLCTGPLSAGVIANGEIEEITFLDGTSWLADDLVGQFDGPRLPAEMAEDLRGEVAMASAERHARDLDYPQAIAYAPDVARLVDRWTITPMSRAIGAPTGATATCFPRQADLRARIIPTNRSNR
jgi:hypothetical protein